MTDGNIAHLCSGNLSRQRNQCCDAVTPHRNRDFLGLGSIAAHCGIKGVTANGYAVILRCNAIPTVGKGTDRRQEHFAVVAKCPHITEIIVVEINGEVIAGCVGTRVAAFDIHKMLETEKLLC